jgi:hypothetical protein
MLKLRVDVSQLKQRPVIFLPLRQDPASSPASALPASTKIADRSLRAACMMRRNDCSAAISYSVKTAYNLTCRCNALPC